MAICSDYVKLQATAAQLQLFDNTLYQTTYLRTVVIGSNSLFDNVATSPQHKHKLVGVCQIADMVA
jgi:hypothetical protein